MIPRPPRRRARTWPFALAIAAGALPTAPAGAQRVPPGIGSAPRASAGNPFQTDFDGADPLARGAGFQPYVEASIRNNITDRGNYRLYVDHAIGVAAFINRDRAEGTAFVRLNYQQPIVGGGQGRLLTNGLVRGTLDAVRNRLFLDVSGYANVSVRDAAFGTTIDPTVSNGNLTQVYYGSIQPRFQREIGTFAIVTGRYQAAQTLIDNKVGGGGGSTAGGGGGGQGGQGTFLALRPYSDSFSQTVEGTIANQPHDGRVSIKLTGRHVDQEQKRLDDRFRSTVGNADVRFALTRVVSLVGSVGYEDYKSARQDIKRGLLFLSGAPKLTLDPTNPRILRFLGIGGTQLSLANFYYLRANPLGTLTFLPPGRNYVLNNSGTTFNLSDPKLLLSPGPNTAAGPVLLGVAPLVGPDGDFIPNPTAPRVTTYKQSGLVWNAGFRYAPSRRTLVELRAGQRFADLVVTGMLRQEFRNGLVITGSLSDGIETFGSILTRIVNGVPVSFVSNGRGGTGGCAGGLAPGGGCLGGQTETVTSGVFRSRIGELSAELRRGATTYGIQYSYLNRRYLDAGSTATSIAADLSQREDVTNRFSVRAEHRLTGRSTVTGEAFYGIYSFGLGRGGDRDYLSADARYNLKISRAFDVFSNLTLTEQLVGPTQLAPLDTLGSTRNDRFLASLAFGARYNF